MNPYARLRDRCRKWARGAAVAFVGHLRRVGDDEFAARCADVLIVLVCIGVIVAVAFGWIG